MQDDIKVVSHYRRRSRLELLLCAFGTYAFAAFLVVLAISLATAAWRMYGRMAAASTGENAAYHQLQDAKTQQAQVTENLQNLNTERGVEGELRQRYGVGKPGEGVIKIVTASPQGSASSQSSENIFLRAWHLFFP